MNCRKFEVGSSLCKAAREEAGLPVCRFEAWFQKQLLKVRKGMRILQRPWTRSPRVIPSCFAGISRPSGSTAKAAPFMVDGLGAGAMGFLEWARTVRISGQTGETRQT